MDVCAGHNRRTSASFQGLYTSIRYDSGTKQISRHGFSVSKTAGDKVRQRRSVTNYSSMIACTITPFRNSTLPIGKPAVVTKLTDLLFFGFCLKHHSNSKNFFFFSAHSIGFNEEPVHVERYERAVRVQRPGGHHVQRRGTRRLGT